MGSIWDGLLELELDWSKRLADLEGLWWDREGQLDFAEHLAKAQKTKPSLLKASMSQERYLFMAWAQF